MLGDTALLLALYWRIDQRANDSMQRKTRLVMIILGLFMAFISGFVGFYAADLTGNELPLHIDTAVIPGLFLTMVLMAMIFTGFNQALQALYLSDDLEKLLVAPIRPQAVMTAKLLSRLPSTTLILFIITIPALIAFGLGVGLGLLYYLLGVLLLLISPLFGLSLGALTAIFLVRLLPARRLGEWVGAASIILGLLISIAFYLPSLLSRQGQPLDGRSIAALETFINGFGRTPLPSVWAGRALVALGQGQFISSAFGGLFFYLLITIGLFMATILLANPLYLSGWLRMQSSGTAAARYEDHPGAFGSNSLEFILAYKDWLLRLRDPRQLATLFTGVFFAGFMIFFLLRPNEEGSTILSLSEEMTGTGLELLFSRGILMSALIYTFGWMGFNRVAGSALSIERKSFFILKTAPISASRLMRAKVFGIFLPYAVVTTLLLIASFLLVHFSLLWLPYAWIALLIMGFGMLSYLVSIGFIYPNLEWEDPRRMASRRASWPSLIGSLIYAIFGGIVVIVAFVIAVSSPLLALPVVILGLSVLAGGTWFFVNWCLTRVETAWPRIGV